MNHRSSAKSLPLRLQFVTAIACLGVASVAHSSWAQCEFVAGYLLPTDGGSTDKAGASVSVSGTHAAVSAHQDDDRGSNAGAVNFYYGSGGTWTHTQKVFASDAVTEDQFGRAVAVSGTFAVVGSYKADVSGLADAGAAYVFRYNGSSWVQQQKLTAFDPAAGDNYGYAVAIDGNVIVVGSYLDDDLGTSTGSAYVYRYNGSSWVFEQKLLPPKPTVLFGVSVSVSGNLIAGGSYWDNEKGSGSGSVSVFRYASGAWTHEARLLASDGLTNDYFGRAVSISGSVLVVGAEGRDDRGYESGAAYVFRNSGSTWTQEAKLLTSDQAGYDRLGASVAVRGDSIALGSPYAEDRTLAWPRTDQGISYLFQYQGGGTPWVQINRVLAPDGYYYDMFGTSVGLDESSTGAVTLLVGCPGDARNGTDSGSGYPFVGTCDGQPAGCVTSADCNDNNPCTTDLCSSGTCTNSNNTLSCNDGNACTSNDRCNAGQCAGTAITCNDNNPCTTDSCNPSSGCVYANNTNTCNDGNACTSADRCLNGVCGGTSVACNDNNPCTNDSCNPASGCVYANNTNTCNDGNACTASDRCLNGVCGGTTIACNDNNPCTDDSCNPASGCAFVLDNTNTCSDGNACTTADRCSNGQCVATPLVCNDNNACTSDACVNGACQFTNLTGACNDGNGCTTNDVCSAGTCAGTPINCNDNNPCTTDSCSNGACQYAFNTLTCNDGDACTTSDRCASGLCLGTPINCSDGVACTLDSCANGICQHSAVGCGCLSNADCNDGNACTTDMCSNNTCVYTNNVLACNDGNACTTNDRCANGLCAGVAMSCSDGNPCTDDSCLNGACVYVNNNASCSDGDSCTSGDRCANGQCSGVPVACDDGMSCTVDFCVNGSCVFDSAGCGCASAADCDDNDPCTADTCDSSRVCRHSSLASCCGNGACESGETICDCPDDCAGAPQGPVCGNGLCEAGDGEDCISCPADCNGVQAGNTLLRYCCGDGDGSRPVTCADPRCTSNGWSCTNESVVAACCGDGVCDGNETACSCSEDCGGAPLRELAGKECADGLDGDCDGLIDCADPDCAADTTCWTCDRDGVCEPGEDCKTCPSDCAGDSGGRRQDRFCCGNGYVERFEFYNPVCDGNY